MLKYTQQYTTPMPKLLILGDPKGTHALAAIKVGWSPLDITVWEQDSRNCYAIQRINNQLNVINDDYNLTQLNSLAMKFTSIIGNPPYNVNNNPSYYVKFIKRAYELLEDGGVVSLIVPNRFLDPGSMAGKELSRFNVLSINANVNHHFPGVGTRIASFHAVKEEPTPECKMVFEKEEKVIDWDYTQPMPIQTTSYHSAMVVEKVFNHIGDKLVSSSTQPSGDYLYVDSAYERYHHLKEKGGEKTPISRVNHTNHEIVKNGSGCYFAMDSVEQAELNAWFISRSMLGRFCSLCFANSAQVNFRNLSRMPILSGVEMSDAVLYSYFNLTDEEIDHVESIMNSLRNIT